MNDRLDALTKLLSEGTLSTQDELRQKLEKQKFQVTQSTISRDLRRLNAVRTSTTDGRVVYRLPSSEGAIAGPAAESMVQSVAVGQAVAVIRTSPGSASLVARHLDFRRPPGLIGTIAGDDTIFCAFSDAKVSAAAFAQLNEILEEIS